MIVVLLLVENRLSDPWLVSLSGATQLRPFLTQHCFCKCVCMNVRVCVFALACLDE